MDAHDIILRPVVTEKSMDLMDDKKYTFDVLVSASNTTLSLGSTSKMHLFKSTSPTDLPFWSITFIAIPVLLPI
jgi:hypothetical protein